MRKHILFIALTFTAIVPAYAQNHTLSGYIKEQASAEPLAGVTITVLGQTNSTSTNIAGFYSLRLPAGKYQVNVSYIGYRQESLPLELRADTTVNFALTEASTLINAAVVTAGNELVSIKESGTIGVNIRQVRNAPAFLGEPDIIKYLQTMPGVSSGREGSSQLVVRGGGGDQTLMLLDEVPIFNQNHAFGLISIFNSDALSGAELYKGHIPARYGGRLSSVASMRMRDGNKSEHKQSLTLGTLSLGGLLEGPINKGKGSYIISARRSTPDLLLRAYFAIKKDIEWGFLYSFYDVNAKANYSLGSKNKISASFYNGRDAMDFNNFDTDAGGKKAECNYGLNWGNTSAAIRLETQVNKDIFIHNSVYFSQIGNKTSTTIKDYIRESNLFSHVASRMYEAGLRTMVEQKAGPRHSLTYGINANYQFFSPQTTAQNKDGFITEKGLPTCSLYTGTLFLDDRITFDKLTVEAGLRGSLFHNGTHTVWGIEPRLSANVRVNDNNKAHLSYTRSLQPLISIVKPYLKLPLDSWIPYEGNTISSSNQISAGWTNTQFKNLTVTLEGYYKQLKDLSIIFTPDDYLTGESAAMQATGYAYGVELLATYSRNRLSLTGAYTYSRSMRTIDGSTFPFTYDTPHNINLFGTYTTLRTDKKNHTLSLNVHYRSGLPYVLSEGTYAIGELFLEDNPLFPNTRLKSFFRSDISYSMERTKRNGYRVWQFSILNVTNHTNPYLVYKSRDQYKYTTLFPFMPSFSYKRCW